MSITPVESFTNSALLNVRPPSVVLYKPRFGLAWNGFPNTPRYATLEFLQSTSMLAMCSSLNPRNVHVRPPSVVFITPPPVVPNQYSLGLATEPAAATDRPPRSGPTSRQRSPPNTAESSVIGLVGDG